MGADNPLPTQGWLSTPHTGRPEEQGSHALLPRAKVTSGGQKASSLSCLCPADHCCSLLRYEFSAWYSVPSMCLGLYSVPSAELHLWNVNSFHSDTISHMVFRTVKENENYCHYGYLRWKSKQPAGMHNSCKIRGLQCPGLA